MTASVHVYEGEYGTYAVPPEVLIKAEELNGGKRLNDRRTRGAKYLNWWGRCQDLDARNSMWLTEALLKQPQ